LTLKYIHQQRVYSQQGYFLG